MLTYSYKAKNISGNAVIYYVYKFSFDSQANEFVFNGFAYSDNLWG